jgi:hypothetical protein
MPIRLRTLRGSDKKTEELGANIASRGNDRSELVYMRRRREDKYDELEGVKAKDEIREELVYSSSLS